MTPIELSEIRTRDSRVTDATIEVFGKDSGIGQCFRDRRRLLEFIAELEARLPTSTFPTRVAAPIAAQEAWRRVTPCVHGIPLAEPCPTCESAQARRIKAGQLASRSDGNHAIDP